MKIPFVVDSDASYNVIDKDLSVKLRKNCNELLRLYDINQNIYTYSSGMPLKTVSEFKSNLCWDDKCLNDVEFVVKDG